MNSEPECPDNAAEADDLVDGGVLQQSIALGHSWRLFTHPIAGHHMMGTVQVGFRVGALARSVEGRWYQVIDGIAMPLAQEETARAVEAARAALRHPIR